MTNCENTKYTSITDYSQCECNSESTQNTVFVDTLTPWVHNDLQRGECNPEKKFSFVTCTTLETFVDDRRYSYYTHSGETFGGFFFVADCADIIMQYNCRDNLCIPTGHYYYSIKTSGGYGSELEPYQLTSWNFTEPLRQDTIQFQESELYCCSSSKYSLPTISLILAICLGICVIMIVILSVCLCRKQQQSNLQRVYTNALQRTLNRRPNVMMV
jgi:hypothetical protein